MGKEKDNVKTSAMEPSDIQEQRSLLDAFTVYIALVVLLLVGYFNDLLRPTISAERHRAGYGQLYSGFEQFSTRHIYRRIRGVWNNPICSVPGAHCDVMERATDDHGWTFRFTGNVKKCINMGSYNYLGFASNIGPCTESAVEAVHKAGILTTSTKGELGNTSYLRNLDRLVAEFLGVEAAICCAMGFATNSLNIPCIVNDKCLVISDEKNHASIILGLKTSGATISVFEHNDMLSLEARLREGVLYGNPVTQFPWEKIFIVVEGIYSMEGTICDLPGILALKHKYKAYVYLDEAHSIGALGPNGRGVCDYWRIDPRNVDVLMGTFTKSFRAAGGYIAGTKQLIDFLRKQSHAEKYGGAMPAPVAEQIMTSMRIIMGRHGTNEGVRKISQLSQNGHYFRQRLKQLGFVVHGNDDSPVVPVSVPVPSSLTYCAREMLRQGVAVAAVGFPATQVLEGRIRFCVSAAHTEDMLDYVVDLFTAIANRVPTRRARAWPDQQGIKKPHESLDALREGANIKKNRMQ